MGNFQEIEPALTEKYDYITLIGVFEYGENYIQSDTPYAVSYTHLSGGWHYHLLSGYRSPGNRLCL